MRGIQVPGVSTSKLAGLPTPMLAAFGVLAGGSIIGAAFFMTKGNMTATLIVALGLVVVFLLLALYRVILGWYRKRRANPLSQGLAGNAAAAPQNISEPARRARLDDLRRNFDQGVEKFRAAGKNLYSVPWYVLVGEPGSGKTEAIRHCNVGFPPGLQDQLQGAGGTLNMNWWFTNQAIILDTAGRLMFEEVVPGSTNEWNEFLKLLKGNRPNCPINGILLVIPVDTLIKDSADSIEKKAGKIAQQFDQIQRILGVRFPVFIIITKCDLLNGFREFFDDLNDPQLQHQIMGWSNPAPLDEKFDPKAVINHMENVKKRLTDRRQQLLLDPVNTEDPQGRRIDQVDALYALPDSLTKIAPRLRRYLEMVFVAGEWSPKPLFLRGIYFTSSMTEGSALDAELAEVLGVPVDSLPEGRVWRRDRAYFLRDLFIEKVFREKGLVTRADNADKQQRTRRAIVMTFGFLAVTALALFTWLGSRSLEKRIGVHRDFWVAAAGNDAKFMQIIKKNNAYNDEKNIPIGSARLSVAEFFGNNLELVKSSIDIPYVFKPMTIIGGDIDKNRVEAYRDLYEATILNPLYLAARDKIKNTTAQEWSDPATGTLAQLMKLEYAEAEKKTPETEAHEQVDLDPIFALVLSPADLPKGRADEENLQKAADWIYADNGGKQPWPAKPLQGDAPESRAVVTDAINKTIDYWKAQVTDKSPRMGNILKVKQALSDFRDAENKLLLLKSRDVQKIDPYNAYVTEWQAAYNQLQTAKKTAASEWAIATKDGTATSATLRGLYTESFDKIAGDAQKAYASLIKYTPDKIDASKANSSAQSLYSDRQKLVDAQTALRDWQNSPEAKAILADLATLDDAYLASLKGTDNQVHHRFEVQAQLYELADSRLPRPAIAPATQPAIVVLADAFTAIDADITTAKDSISAVTVQAQDKDRLSQAGELARSAIDIGARFRRYTLAKDAADTMPSDADKWADFITARAALFPPEHLVRPQVPLKVADPQFLAKYSPDAVGGSADSAIAVEKLCNDSGNKVLDSALITTRIAAVKAALNSYLVNYRRYWQKEAFDELHFAPKTWTEFAAALANVRERTVRGALDDYGAKAVFALNRINDPTSAAAIATEGQLGQRQAFEQECSDILGHWKDLGDNYRQARGTILIMDPNKFLDQYTVATAKSSDGYVARYWTALSLEALKVLSNDSQKDIQDGLIELGKYERFPLAPPGDKKSDLTAQEVLLARAAVEKIKGATGVGMVAGARSVGQGGLTKDKDVDGVLERLRGINLLKDTQAYLNALDKFFADLPADAKPLSVTLTVIKDKLADPNSVAKRYGYVDITQAKFLKQAFLQGNVVDAVDLEYPSASDLTLAFRENSDKPVIQTDTIPGPWSPFRLIASPNVKVISSEGKKWVIEYTVKDPTGKTYPMWFQLDFKADLPDLKDWPVPPTNGKP